MVALVGATFHLDSMAVGQCMISRPIVLGPCLGWLVGDAWTGFLIGVWIELLWARAIPVGLDVPPELGGVTVLATGWMGRIPAVTSTGIVGSPEGIGRLGIAVLAVALASPWGWIGRRCDVALRGVNRWFADAVEARLTAGRPPRLGQTVALAIGLRWFVIAGGYWVALFLGGQVLPLIVVRWGWALAGRLEVVGWLFPIAGLAVVLEWFLRRS